MPPSVGSSVTAPVYTLGKGGCGSLSSPAGSLNRGSAAAAAENM